MGRVPVAGSPSTALRFLLNNVHWVQVANNAALQGLTALTVEAWVRLAFPSGAMPYVARIIGFNSGNTGFDLRGSNNSTNAGFQIVVGNGTTTGSAATVSATDGRFSNHAVHVAGTWDGSTVTLWINGVSAATAALSGGNTGNPAQVLAIGSNTSGGRTFPGTIEKVRISNLGRYTVGFTPATAFATDANTIALWQLNENTGTSVADASANGLTGTLTATSPYAVPTWAEGVV